MEEKYVQNIYEEIAIRFNHTRAYYWKGIKDFLLNLDKHSFILDAGCGNGKHMLLRFNFGNEQQILAADALKANLIDKIYWESYQSNANMMLGDAISILSTVNDFIDKNDASNRVLLAFETNCCLKPCIDSKCYSCHTKPFFRGGSAYPAHA